VHRCPHRALAQAVTWRLIAHNPTAHATPPPVPRTQAVTLAPEQVAVLLDAAGHTSSPWLGIWTVLAAATGARNGELCGLEWADLDLNAGTVQFRQTLTIIDPTVLFADIGGNGGAGKRGGRKELAVGPLKSAASNAILTLPPSPSRHCTITAANSTDSTSASASPHPPATLGRAGPTTPPGRARPGLPH
jgi:integrase